MSISSRPNRPPSPACGFRPLTAILGAAMPIRRSVRAVSAMTRPTRSRVMASSACRTLWCSVACAIFVSPKQSIMKTWSSRRAGLARHERRVAVERDAGHARSRFRSAARRRRRRPASPGRLSRRRGRTRSTHALPRRWSCRSRSAVGLRAGEHGEPAGRPLRVADAADGMRASTLIPQASAWRCQDGGIADQDRPAGRPHGRIERGLEADLRPDAGGVAGRDGDDRFVGCHGVFYGPATRDANGRASRTGFFGGWIEQGALDQNDCYPARLHPRRAPPDWTAAHARGGAALSQPLALQHRAARRHAAGVPAGGPAREGALPGGGAVCRLRAGAARLSAAAVDIRVGRWSRPRNFHLSRAGALGLGGALARSRPARAQAGVPFVARARHELFRRLYRSDRLPRRLCAVRPAQARALRLAVRAPEHVEDRARADRRSASPHQVFAQACRAHARALCGLSRKIWKQAAVL